MFSAPPHGPQAPARRRAACDRNKGVVSRARSKFSSSLLLPERVAASCVTSGMTSSRINDSASMTPVGVAPPSKAFATGSSTSKSACIASAMKKSRRSALLAGSSAGRAWELAVAPRRRPADAAVLVSKKATRVGFKSTRLTCSTLTPVNAAMLLRSASASCGVSSVTPASISEEATTLASVAPPSSVMTGSVVVVVVEMVMVELVSVVEVLVEEVAVVVLVVDVELVAVEVLVEVVVVVVVSVLLVVVVLVAVEVLVELVEVVAVDMVTVVVVNVVEVRVRVVTVVLSVEVMVPVDVVTVIVSVVVILVEVVVLEVVVVVVAV
mmetsp:Transcript_13571/g.34916  ORF Transcript_13571/g.34916 Transcript_13571/m.34916 type:complete len:324 (-) Transcript_13571:1062-2033(-)